MKKIHLLWVWDSYALKKIFRIMRIIVLLLVLGVANIFAESSYAQKTKVSINLTNRSVSDVLEEIESQSEFYFLYNSKLINIDRRVNVNAQEEPIYKILDDLFEGTNTGYEVYDNKIILAPSDLNQQIINITGTVTDDKGEIIPGATIVVKGTKDGTITDMNGKFVLTGVPVDAVLVVSFIGMKSQDISIEGRAVINVSMNPDVIGLDEIVAIGYGTMKKSDLTGSVGSVKGEVISARKSTQLSTALQGSVSGLMVTRDNSAPGSTATIRVRGVTSIGESSPLIIVDGVSASSINDVNPNDVESISVLKDAASASIYGSRAAAGVILITTKRAKTGQLTLNYNYEFGFEKPTEMSDYVGAQRYMQMVNELRWNDNGNVVGGEYPTYTQNVVDNYSSLHSENPDLYPDTDWVDLVLKNKALRKSHMLSITAGSDIIRTKVSLGYDETEGLYIGRNYKRLSARINNDVTINKSISASFDFNANRSISENPSMDPIYYMRLSAPVYAAVWSNGLIAEGKSGGNIYGQIKEGGYDNYWNNQVGGKASIDFIPFDGMKISAVVAPELNYKKEKDFTKKVQYTNYDDPTTYVGTIQWAQTTDLTENRNDNYHVTTQFLANYNKSINEHSFNVMAGYENYFAHYENLGAATTQMELSSYPYLDLANDNYLSNSGYAYENAYRSWFGRVMYNYKNRYFLQGNIRYDGSSRFASDYRWGSFPSFSAGWVISEESFMQDLSALSFLKLRASWGMLGNERIGNYPYQSTIGYASALFYQGSNIVSSQTAAQWAYAIEDISWETTESFDIGLDASFFNNRLRLTADYYEKVTKDMLLELEIPDYIGFDNPDQNTGKMNTKGWDLEIGWNDSFGDFHYSVSANISDFKSVMGDLGGIEFLDSKVKFKGSEFNEWYGYKADGLFQTQEEVDNSAVLNSKVSPGDIKYKDISGPDGVPDGIISSDYDRVLLGGSLPRYIYGANIFLGYKNLDLSLVLQGVGKQNARLNNMMVQPLQENWGAIPELIDGKYWSSYNSDQQNQNAKYPRLTYNNVSNNYAMSDYWLFNGGYLRLKNITVGYNLPKSVTEKLKIGEVRIYSSVSDLFSIDKYPKGWDPEVASSGYPITTSFVFGASVKF